MNTSTDTYDNNTIINTSTYSCYNNTKDYNYYYYVIPLILLYCFLVGIIIIGLTLSRNRLIFENYRLNKYKYQSDNVRL